MKKIKINGKTKALLDDMYKIHTLDFASMKIGGFIFKECLVKESDGRVSALYLNFKKNKLPFHEILRVLLGEYEVIKTPQERALEFYKGMDKNDKIVIKEFLEEAEMQFEGITE